RRIRRWRGLQRDLLEGGRRAAVSVRREPLSRGGAVCAAVSISVCVAVALALALALATLGAGHAAQQDWRNRERGLPRVGSVVGGVGGRARGRWMDRGGGGRGGLHPGRGQPGDAGAGVPCGEIGRASWR